MTRVWLLLLGLLATVGFAAIVLVGIPSVLLLRVPRPPQLPPYTALEAEGRAVYIANGCLYCHTQQVRDTAFTTDVLRGWGERPSVPSDYIYDRPQLLGTMRTGPDLANVGIRLPDANWHLIHLYNPRAVVSWSIMAAFPYLFDEKAPGDVRPGDRVVPIQGPRAPRGKVVVARPEALALVAYLLSLKRAYPAPAPEAVPPQLRPGAPDAGPAVQPKP